MFCATPREIITGKFFNSETLSENLKFDVCLRDALDVGCPDSRSRAGVLTFEVVARRL